jgi:ArsR family transcriptional regulator
MNVDIECVDHIDRCQFTWQTGSMANVTLLQGPASTAVDAGAECCAPPVRESLAAEGAEKLAKTLKAIADPARLRLISMVAAHDDAEACVCDLTEPLGLSQPTVSHHLKVLVDAGILSRDKRGTWAYYRLVPGALDALAHSVVTV